MAKIRKINVSEIRGINPSIDSGAIMPAGTIVVYESNGRYTLRVHDGVTDGGNPFPNAPNIEHNNNINITVDSGDSSSYTWDFGQTGELTTPGNIKFQNGGYIEDSESFFVATNGDFAIQTNKTAGQKEWNFNANGILTLPVGGDIVDSEGASVLGGGVDQNIWVETFATNDIEGSIVQIATSVEYDANGNIFALFSHLIPGVDNETYASVAKLTPTGAVLWQVRFAANLNTDGWGLAYDGSDSVYIAGQTAGPGLDYSLATLTKIDAADGTIVWNKTYDFGANSQSAVVDVDSDLDPIMVGYADTPQEENNRIITTKVNQADGSVVWSKTLDGQGDDRAYGMAVGPTGEVVTVGYVAQLGSGINNAAATLYTDPVNNSLWTLGGAVTGGDGVTMNFTFTDGVPTFTNIVDPVGGRSVDDVVATVPGSSIIVGGSNAEFDISVSGAPTLATITTTDLATATATGTMVKNADNIVTPGGWGNWLVFPDSALRVTLEGLFTMNQVIPVQWDTGSTSATGFIMIQFPGDGTFQITPVQADGSEAVAGTWYFDLLLTGLSSYSVSVTNGGLSYRVGHRIKVLGSALGGVDVTNDAIITVATVTSGVIDTVTIAGTTAGAAETYTGVTGTSYTDSSDDMIVKVETVAANDTDDRMVVIKYAADGTIAWQKAVQFEVGYDCKGADADIDADGDIYVCGSYDNFIGSAMSLVKFDSSGVKQWSRKVIGNCQDFATSVVVGPDNYLYLSGVTISPNNEDINWVVAKYNTFGAVEWQRLINNTASWSFAGGTFIGDGGGSNIAVRNGYVALGGGFGIVGGGEDPTATVVQIDTAGTPFSTGDWDFTGASFSGTLDDSASNITVVDADKTSATATPTVEDFIADEDLSNFLSATRYSLASGNTGDITFDGVKIIGRSADERFGLIRLIPALTAVGQTGSINFENFGQYIDIYPTNEFDTPHIHIAAGQGVDSEGDLFLGNDQKYVKIGNNGVISIQSYLADPGNTSLWTFGTDGNLTVPGDIRSMTDASIVVGKAPMPNIFINAVDYEEPFWRVFVNSDTYPNLGIDIQVGDTFTTAWGTPVTVTIQQILDDRVGSDQWVFYVDQNVLTGWTYGDEATFTPVPETWTFGTDGSITFPDATVQTTALVQGEQIFTVDTGNTAYAPTAVDFNLLLVTSAAGYSETDPTSVTLPNGVPGQRLVIFNGYSLATFTVNPGPVGRDISSGVAAEFIYTSMDGWIPLYGTV